MRIAPIAAVALSLALAACQKPGTQATVGPSGSASASSHAAAKGPRSRSPLQIEGGRLVLPAVKGLPGAAYFMLDNSSGATAILTGISVDGSHKADMHQTAGDTMSSVERVEVAPGTSISFEPGKLHVMVYDIEDRLKAGGTTQMVLIFADGEKVSAPMKIEAAGSGDSSENSH